MAGPQILVVEDNEKNMKLFRDVLQAEGYRTLEATTGGQAVELATEHVPDLVLMDIQLPDLDGVEALGRLRADERTASIPVLALTAQAMEGDRERFLAAGFDGYLSKPVNIAELVATVSGTARRRLDERRPRGEDPRRRRRPRERAAARGGARSPRLRGRLGRATARTALELVEAANPDLVLLDVLMPGPDGYAVCSRLRERAETAVLPVIMLTASEGREDEGDRGRRGRLHPQAVRPR